MNYETIILDEKDHIVTITLNRPEKLNAFNPTMYEELIDAFAAINKDDEARVVIVTGAGRAFCSGADIQEGWQEYIDERKVQAEVGKLETFTPQIVGTARDDITLAWSSIKKPVIAAVNGYAVGAGANMTLNSDIVIASEEAKFSFPFNMRGFSPGFGNTYNLPRLVGIHKACELIFTSKMIDAKEAEKIGLVNVVVPADELMKTTYEWASSIAKASPEAVQISKRTLYHGLNHDLATQVQLEVFAMNFLHMTPAFDEATRAFLAKEEGTRAYQL